MPTMQRIFILAFAFVVTLAAGFAAFIFASLWPYFFLIGRVATGVVMVGLACLAVLMISFTYTKVCNWHNRRRLVIAGDVVAYLNWDGGFIHLSAMHEQAKLQLPAPPIIVDEDQKGSDETVLELWRDGVSLRNIELATKRSYGDIQRLTSEQKKIEGDPKKKKKAVIAE
jgi:fermentation-respiration switch protein FrsA (DUF1100 family)